MVGDRRIHKRPFGLTNLPRLCGTISEEPKRGGKCAPAYVRPDWDDALKKKKQRKKLTRRGRRQRGGGARGKDGGGGNICEATTLWKGSAACPPVCKDASCTTHTDVHVHTHKDVNA